LTSPVLRIISEIPTTPCRRISSATKKASVTGVCCWHNWSNLSLDDNHCNDVLAQFFNIFSACITSAGVLTKGNESQTTPTVTSAAVLRKRRTKNAQRHRQLSR
jgi:hypothetical protein